jgi:hypothetical protein
MIKVWTKYIETKLDIDKAEKLSSIHLNTQPFLFLSCLRQKSLKVRHLYSFSALSMSSLVSIYLVHTLIIEVTFYLRQVLVIQFNHI